MDPKKTFIGNMSAGNFGTPSSAWQNYGAKKTVSNPSGTVMTKKPETTTPVTPSNTSATGTTGTKITSPAGQAYVNNMASQATQPPIVPTTPSTSSTPSYQDTPEYKEYLKYTRNKENPSEAETARKAYEANMQRLADAQNLRDKAELDARKGYEKTLDTPGGLRAGTRAGAGVYARRSNDDIADLALAENAAARSAGVAQTAYQPYQEIEIQNNKPLTYEEAQSLGVAYGTTVGEAKELGIIPKSVGEGFSLSEGQARYDAEGNLIASRGKTYAPSSGGGTGIDGSSVNVSPQAQSIIDLMNTTGGSIDDYIKGNSITSQNLRNQVIAGLNAQGGLTDKAAEILEEGKAVVDKMLLDESYKALGGYSSRLGGQFTTSFGDAKAMALQLESILARDNLGLLKGAMSDNDLKFIKAMSAGFEGEGIQSEKFIKEKLEEIQTKLSNKVGGSAGTPPAQQMELNGVIYTLQPDGSYQ